MPERVTDATDALECVRWVVSAGTNVHVPQGDQLGLVGILQGLEAIEELRGWLDAEEARLVAEARKPRNPDAVWWYDRRQPRHTWEEIAAALGVPKSSVHRRYGNPPPR